MSFLKRLFSRPSKSSISTASISHGNIESQQSPVQRNKAFEKYQNLTEQELGELAAFLLNIPHKGAKYFRVNPSPGDIEVKSLEDHVKLSIRQGNQSNRVDFSAWTITDIYSTSKQIKLEPNRVRQAKTRVTNGKLDFFDFDRKRTEKLKKEKQTLKKSFSSQTSFPTSHIADLERLLAENQSRLTVNHEEYIHSLVKLQNYIKEKESNIQAFLRLVLKVDDYDQFTTGKSLLENERHTYNTLVLCAFSMLTALLDEDMVTFFKIYETVDSLGVLNSSWEREVSDKLNNIEEGVTELMYTLQEVGENISEAVKHSLEFNERTAKRIANHLEEIDSKLDSANLISLVQTYQLHRIKKKL